MTYQSVAKQRDPAHSPSRINYTWNYLHFPTARSPAPCLAAARAMQWGLATRWRAFPCSLSSRERGCG